MSYNSPIMGWTPRRIIALFLGLWMALAPAGFAVPAAAMTAQTGMSDGAGSGECDGCSENVVERGLCALMCLNAALVASAVQPDKLITDFGDCHEPGRHAPMLGRLTRPDPAPPRIVFPL